MKRLDPESEIILRARLTVLRILCNWVWPMVVLAKFIWDAVSLIGDADPTWWWLFDIGWYAVAWWLWAGDVRDLRKLRAEYTEAHS